MKMQLITIRPKNRALTTVLQSSVNYLTIADLWTQPIAILTHSALAKAALLRPVFQHLQADYYAWCAQRQRVNWRLCKGGICTMIYRTRKEIAEAVLSQSDLHLVSYRSQLHSCKAWIIKPDFPIFWFYKAIQLSSPPINSQLAFFGYLAIIAPQPCNMLQNSRIGLDTNIKPAGIIRAL